MPDQVLSGIEYRHLSALRRLVAQRFEDGKTVAQISEELTAMVTPEAIQQMPGVADARITPMTDAENRRA